MAYKIDDYSHFRSHDTITIKFFFIDVGTKLDTLIIEHWLNILQDVPEFSSGHDIKHHLISLLNTQMQERICVSPFNQLPECFKRNSLPHLERYDVTFHEIKHRISQEKYSRLISIAENMYKEMLVERNLIGVFIVLKDEGYIYKMIPAGHPYQTEISQLMDNNLKNMCHLVKNNIIEVAVDRNIPSILITIYHVITGTKVDLVLLENWLRLVEDSNADGKVKNQVLVLLNIQIQQRICVPPFNVLPNVSVKGVMPNLSEVGLSAEIIHERIDVEKRDRLKNLAENLCYSKLEIQKRGGLFIADDDPNYAYKILPETLPNPAETNNGIDRLNLKQVIQDLKTAKAAIASERFKREALDILRNEWIKESKKTLQQEQLQAANISTGNLLDLSDYEWVTPEHDLITFVDGTIVKKPTIGISFPRQDVTSLLDQSFVNVGERILTPKKPEIERLPKPLSPGRINQFDSQLDFSEQATRWISAYAEFASDFEPSLIKSAEEELFYEFDP